MNSLIIIFLTLLALLLVCRMFSPNVLLTPEFGYIVCFIPQTLYCFYYVDKWEINLHPNTTLTLTIGPLIFVVVSIFTRYVARRSHTIGYRKFLATSQDALPNINKSIYRWKLYLILGFQFIVLLWTVRELLSNYGVERLAIAINLYRSNNLFTDNIFRLPAILRASREFCIAAGFIWTYLVAQAIVYKKKDNLVLLILNLVFSVINNSILGGRTGIFQYAVSFFVIYYFLSSKRKKFKNIIKGKHILLGCAILAIAIFTFQSFGNLLGREDSRNAFDYMAIYLSGEIKNLDIFIRNGKFGVDISKVQTLLGGVNFIGQTFHIDSIVHTSDIPFHYINGYSLGNVYTTYYSYIYDLGFIGVPIFTSIMAIICQLTYQSVLETKCYKVNLRLLLYSYFYFTIIFSFFHTKFYEMVVSVAFLKMIIYWIILLYFIFKVKVRSS